MSNPYIGEIKIVAFNFPPKGWAFCNGQLLAINQNQALFSILGTTYGGNGQTTFALPNFQGRTAVHSGGSILLGQNGGETAHTLTQAELPSHSHVAFGTTNTANTSTPVNNLWSQQPAVNSYGIAPDSVMAPQSLSNVGGNQAHSNLQPYLVLNFIIALVGIFPPHS
jgi:microcystin-dependent protein